MTPAVVAAAFLPPKSMEAVPESMPCTPMTHMDMKKQRKPTMAFHLNIRAAIITTNPANMPA